MLQHTLTQSLTAHSYRYPGAAWVPSIYIKLEAACITKEEPPAKDIIKEEPPQRMTLKSRLRQGFQSRSIRKHHGKRSGHQRRGGNKFDRVMPCRHFNSTESSIRSRWKFFSSATAISWKPTLTTGPIWDSRQLVFFSPGYGVAKADIPILTKFTLPSEREMIFLSPHAFHDCTCNI